MSTASRCWLDAQALSFPERAEAAVEDCAKRRPISRLDYLAAFDASGLRLMRCAEPTISEHELGAKRRAFRHIPEATAAAYLGLPAVLVLAATKA